MWLLIFTLWHKKDNKGNEIYVKQIKPTVKIYIYTKRIGHKTNQNKRNRRTQSKRRDQRNTSYPLTQKNVYLESKQQQR